MTVIVTADVDRIALNPYRRLHAFPYIEKNQGSFGCAPVAPALSR
jgi:hypothetical protein